MDIESLDKSNRSEIAVVALDMSRADSDIRLFFDELLRVAQANPKNLVLDLRCLNESPGLAFGYLLEDVWLTLTEKGRGMSVVVQEGLAKSFHEFTFARCPIAESVSDAEAMASVVPAIMSLEADALAQLDKIETRFRDLVKQRISHLWKQGQPRLPPVGRLFRCGVSQGHFPFPYGTLSWQLIESDNTFTLKYDDCARVAFGWGRAYDITSDETRLVAEGLD